MNDNSGGSYWQYFTEYEYRGNSAVQYDYEGPFNNGGFFRIWHPDENSSNTGSIQSPNGSVLY